MRDDEALKLVSDTLRNGMQKFIGEPNTGETRETIKAHVETILHSFKNVANIRAPLPTVEVSVHNNQASIYFRDPKTGGYIDPGVWISKAIEGFYD